MIPMHQPDCVAIESTRDVLSVVCLCAEWCGTCREYKTEFDRLASVFPDVRFLWCDIEDNADALGDLDIENFPTLCIRRGDLILFFGVMLPQIGLLRRLIESFSELSPDQARSYAFSSPERSAWQINADLSLIGLNQQLDSDALSGR